jgi:hypothetical protein
MLSTMGMALASWQRLSALTTGFGSQPADFDRNSRPTDGSGHFGQWIDDEFGLPAYRYTCNQLTDPKAVTAVTPGVLAANEHIHQVGNDRITAIASNFGHIRVRQDEGAPKFLNDLDPENSQFAGGIGYLTDGHETLSTYYDGSQLAFERVFGVGYFRKSVTDARYSVDQVISAPFGDDPVLLSQVTLTNRTDTPQTVRWVEYWGCQPYEFSFRAFIESFSGIGTTPALRRQLGRRFKHSVSAVNGKQGLIETRHFSGRTPQDESVWKNMKAGLKAHPNAFLSAIDESLPGAAFDSFDLPQAIPQTFLVSLDAPASGFSTDAATFFGKGGVSAPSGLAAPLDGNLGATGASTGMLLERTIQLAPKEKRTLSFLYGYLPTSFRLEALIARYRPHPAQVLKESSRQWKERGMRFQVAGEPWIQREATWNHYYLRSSMTYDDYFGKHILNQNGFYQFVMGFQGAARDPLQHCLPFLFSDPEIVRSVLRYTLQEVRDDGSIPYALTGHGQIAPIVSDNASDLPLWLIWTASEYVLATRDLDFLNEKIPARYSDAAGRSESVRNLLARCFEHQIRDVGVGSHGIVRMLNDDWNDGLLGTWAQAAFSEAVAQGESVLNSAMSAWVFDDYARLLRFAPDKAANAAESDLATRATKAAEQHRQAARAQWTGKWLKRCWLGPTLGWLGEDTLWIEPQPWAILAGVTSTQQSRELVRTMDNLLRRGPLGAAQMSDGPDLRKPGAFEPGTCVRGAVWPSLNQTLVWALAGVDPAMAWDEWKKNSFAHHADAYPDVWYGIWSGTDSYNSPLSRHPGETANDPYFRGLDFPVLNLHAHACFLYSATKLLGIEFTEDGVSLSPDLPVESYRFDAPLLSVSKSVAGHYEGSYAPSRAGTWTLRITLPEPSAKSIVHAEVNGKQTPLKRNEDGEIVLAGKSSPGSPLSWALRP